MENLAYKNNNVVGLNVNNLYSHIELFLNSKSTNTKRSYSSYIDNFFMFMLNKHINNVTWEDITNKTVFNIANVDRYFLYLQNELKDGKGKNLSNKTINVYMASIKSLFRTLIGYGEELGYKINEKIFININRLSESSVNHWGEMEDFEIWNLIEYARTERYEGMGKSIYFETLFSTGLRKTATLNLIWDNLTQQYDRKNKTKYWQINIVDKSKEISFPIADELYNKLLSIKINNSNMIFNFGEKEARETFDRYCKKFGIDKDKRNLSLHSIKHSGVLKTLSENGYDYELTKQYSHHSQTSTLFNYTNKSIDLSNSPTYNFYNKTDMSILEDLTHEELIDLIKGSPVYVQKILTNKANQIKNKKDGCI